MEMKKKFENDCFTDKENEQKIQQKNPVKSKIALKNKGKSSIVPPLSVLADKVLNGNDENKTNGLDNLDQMKAELDLIIDNSDEADAENINVGVQNVNEAGANKKSNKRKKRNKNAAKRKAQLKKKKKPIIGVNTKQQVADDGLTVAAFGDEINQGASGSGYQPKHKRSGKKKRGRKQQEHDSDDDEYLGYIPMAMYNEIVQELYARFVLMEFLAYMESRGVIHRVN